MGNLEGKETERLFDRLAETDLDKADVQELIDFHEFEGKLQSKGNCFF